MKKIVVVVLAVILTLSLSLTSIAFAAGGKAEVALAQEAGQSWLNNIVAVAGESVEWIGARLTAPQVCYDLKGKPDAYMFTMENNGEVVGYMIVGSSAYGYAMFEAADVPPPSIPSAVEGKSIVERDLGLKVGKIDKPARLLYLGFDNLFAVYQAGQQEIAVNLIFDFAILASNLTASIPSPEDYKTDVKATTEANPDLLGSSGYNLASVASSGFNQLNMNVYYDIPTGRTWCGPCSGTSIGMYYRNVRGYTNLPYYWWNQYDWISWYMGAPGPIPPFAYGIGFVQFTQAFGYNIFGHVDDYFVTGGDYWHRTADIDNGWPVAIYSNNFYYPPGGPDTDSPHWVAMRGYQWYDNQYVIECTDSFRGTSTLWLNFNHLGFGIVTVTIKD